MIISSTDGLMGSYRLSINSPMHWTLVLIALLGLLISCRLIYLSFKGANSHSIQKIVALNFRKKLHLSLLFLVNIIAFICVLLFVLPFETKVQKSSSLNVLLTQGFKKVAGSDDFNIIGLDNSQIEQYLTSAERIWLLSEQENLIEKEALQQWLAENYQDKVVVINSVQELTDFWTMSRVKQSNDFGEHYNVPSLVWVFGDGLTKAQWQHLGTIKRQVSLLKANVPAVDDPSVNNLQAINSIPLNGVEFIFFASKVITGVSNLHWSKQLTLGQALTVTGQLQQPIEDNVKFELSLVNNNRVLDSITLSGNAAFSLTTTSKVSGLFSYQLVLRELPKNRASKKVVLEISEDIAFSVVIGNQPSVLIKQSAPSFETRRLKQWLSQAGSQVHVISQISKREWAQQKVNTVNNSFISNAVTERDSNNHQQKVTEQGHYLNEELLDNYDLLILDSRMFLALEDNEIEALYHAIINGLGLLINADSTLLSLADISHDKRKKLLSLFQIMPADESLHQIMAYWPEKPSLDISQTITPQSASIAINAKLGQSIVESGIGQSLVAKQSLGLGNVAITALNHTYQWSSQINSAFYSHYWQHLILQISRSERDSRWLVPSPSVLARVNKHQDICLISTVENVYVAEMQLTAYPLSNGRKCSRFLADDEGWHSFQALNDKQAVLAEQVQYFYSEEDFSAEQQAIKYHDSKGYATEKRDENITLSHTESLNSPDAYRAVNKFSVWLMMFISLALLWIERKWRAE
ncbi:hypothetical protein H4J38_11270 [Colwellia sp. BRX10-3]|uniref:hypothetical protein n=1 Tax=Colwellia sp. BRX10-3 TaxID=2759844 RepID=UPI0015F68DE9|nr:hypothetical protein [Colwellia sp. BRX10-3]MBA6391351.1 hypothetical protein [Colwellia sp. BRX10-3]